MRSLSIILVFFTLEQGDAWSSTFYRSICGKCLDTPPVLLKRRDALLSFFAPIFLSRVAPAIASNPDRPEIELDRDTWRGTSLRLLSPEQAADGGNSFVMARWPDPILRRPSSQLQVHVEQPSLSGKGQVEENSHLRRLAYKLRRTARVNGAVGLAAQQCGIDGSLIFLDDPQNKKNARKRHLGGGDDEGGFFLFNPRVVSRSSELRMNVWREECLVLPPDFTATVLRDSTIGVEYETLSGKTKFISLRGELSRAFQHEFDHDRGILLLDHISLDEMDTKMRNIETKGHDKRSTLAFSRFLSEPRVRTGSDFVTTIKDTIVQPTNAIENIPMGRERSDANVNSMIDDKISTNESKSLVCDEACKEERKRIIEGRRAMMNQARSTSQRSEVLELSRQRAKLYGTDFKGATCPPGIPCI